MPLGSRLLRACVFRPLRIVSLLIMSVLFKQPLLSTSAPQTIRQLSCTVTTFCFYCVSLPFPRLPCTTHHKVHLSFSTPCESIQVPLETLYQPKWTFGVWGYCISPICRMMVCTGNSISVCTLILFFSSVAGISRSNLVLTTVTSALFVLLGMTSHIAYPATQPKHHCFI